MQCANDDLDVDIFSSIFTFLFCCLVGIMMMISFYMNIFHCG